MWGLYLVVKTSISAGLKIMDYVLSFVDRFNCYIVYFSKCCGFGNSPQQRS